MSTSSGKPTEKTDMMDCDGEKVVTMMDVLQEQEEFEEDANAVLGASDEKNCTYPKGYIKRQAIYACLTCCPEAKSYSTMRAGVCLACSLNCHENHELIELYTKRNFRCDCGNPKFNSNPCQFVSMKADLNPDNKYNQNFSGLYCTCERPYPDPECTIEDEMIQCIICEDWLHAGHLETTVPENEQYSEMICKGCMEKNEFLHDYSDLVINNEASDVDVLNVTSVQQEAQSIVINECNGSADKLSSDVNEIPATNDNEENSTTENLPNEQPSKPEEKKTDSLEPDQSCEIDNKDNQSTENNTPINSSIPEEVLPENKNTLGSDSSINNEESTTRKSNDNNEDNNKIQIPNEKTEEANTMHTEVKESDITLPEEENKNENTMEQEKVESNISTELKETDIKEQAYATDKELDENIEKETVDNKQVSVKDNSNEDQQKNSETDDINISKDPDVPDNIETNINLEVPSESNNIEIQQNGIKDKSPTKHDNSEGHTTEKKRKLSTEASDSEEVIKKSKLEDLNACLRPKNVKTRFKGATFWPSNFRQKLCTCNECISMYKDLAVLFLIDPDDTVTAYEMLGKERINGAAVSQYEKGLEALSSLDRIQQINALTEYNKMRDKLLDFLKSFKDRKEVVKEEDIKAFFAGMKPKREPDGVYFCR